MQHVGPRNGVPQPACPKDPATLLIQCNWSPAYTLTTQTSWTSGIYLAVLTNAQSFYNNIIFVVRDDSRVAALLYQQPVNTYQAYNSWGGASLYSSPRAYKVSFDRPYQDDGTGDFLFLGENNFVRWMEMSGYDVSYSTSVDTHINGSNLLNYRGFLAAGHNEYWSRPMYDAANAARDAGVNLAFLGANPVFWQVRFESSNGGVPNRVMVCYKDATLDPTTDPTLTTVNWRDPLLNRPEQVLVGVMYTSSPKNANSTYAVTNSGNWAYAGTGLKDGDTVPGIVGYEADRSFTNYPAPNALPGTYILLSHSLFTDQSNNSDYQNTSIYQAPSGAWVFGSGSIYWSWALDNYYPDGNQLSTVDGRIQQTMTNILNRYAGVIQDTQAPTAPAALTATASGSQINLSWTASTDNVGVTSYLVERCQGAGCTTFAQIATPTGTTYSDNALAPNTSYSYRVRASDAAGNLSSYSNTATASTASVATPTAPTNLTTSAGPGPAVVAAQSYLNTSALTLHTTATFDSTGGDLIVVCASSHAGVTLTPSDSFGNTYISIAGPTSTALGTDLRTQLWYAGKAVVGPGHTVSIGISAPQSLVISVVVVKGSDTSSPVGAVSLIGDDNGTITVNVSSPNLTTTGSNNLLINFVKPSMGATFTAGAGFTQLPLASTSFLNAQTGPAATPGTYNSTLTLSQANTWQSVLVAAANNPNQLNLSWTASTENGGTIGNYLVERCQGTGCSNFTQIGTVVNTSFNDLGLTSSTTYSYRVRAQDTVGTVGPYSSVISFTTPAPIPALPGNLAATTVSSTQINLSWTASTETAGTIGNYLVERCQGAGCSSFTQIGTSATTSYSDTGLGGGSFTYRVRAKDAAGNLGPYSNLASDVLAAAPPTAPTNLAATAASVSQINLSWTGSTSSIGIANYVVQRCQGAGCTNFAQIATPTGTTYNDTGLLANTNYSYRVEAVDTAGTLSTFSNVASATTFSPTGVIGYVQGNYATPQTSQTTVSVTYTVAQAAGDLNVVVVGWNDTTATVSSVTDKSGNAYTLAVGPTAFTGIVSQSIYYAKNIKSAAAGANIVTVTFSTAAAYPDIRILEYSGADPNSPVDVTTAASGSSTTTNSGSATTTNATDLIFGASMVATFTTGPGTGFTQRLLTSPDGDIAEDRMVTATGSYSATTAALSPAGQWVMQMVAFRTPVGTGALPTAPSNLTDTASGPVQINLSWTAATETGGTISQYLIERCSGATCTNFVQVGTSPTTTFSNTSLLGSTVYNYRVRAQDSANNTGPYSNTASVTTAAPTFTAPSNLTATAAGSTQISLSWTAATETGGTISQYLIERCTGATCSNFVQVASSPTTTFNDTGLTGSTSYSYRVRASDAANNLGPYSNTASATTPANAPTAPTNLTATASGPVQINLSWTAATETGGTISQYLIERCTGATCSNFVQVASSPTTTFNDTGLTGSTAYSYRVRAQDAANNLGPYSNVVSATTSAPTFTAPSNLTATAASTTQINLSWTAATETGGT